MNKVSGKHSTRNSRLKPIVSGVRIFSNRVKHSFTLLSQHGVLKSEAPMRYPAVEMDLSLNRPFEGRRMQKSSLVARIHWPRTIGLVVALGMWPAIIFAATRFF